MTVDRKTQITKARIDSFLRFLDYSEAEIHARIKFIEQYQEIYKLPKMSSKMQLAKSRKAISAINVLRSFYRKPQFPI